MISCAISKNYHAEKLNQYAERRFFLSLVNFTIRINLIYEALPTPHEPNHDDDEKSSQIKKILDCS